MLLYMVRHGQTDFNLQQRYAGSTDVPLNENGINQAYDLSRKLTGIEFDVIISSSLRRAKQTADIISKSFPSVPVIAMKCFNERNLGGFEGLTRVEAKEQFPEMYANNCTRQLDNAPPNGETIRQVDERILKALDLLKVQYVNQVVLLVTHGFVSRIVNRQIKGLSFTDMHSFTLENCQIIEYYL